MARLMEFRKAVCFFDFIAEMVLGYADSQVSEVLASNDITDYKILRYRDDYRIFCNRKDELEKIAFVLQDILANLNFQLNSKKTLLTCRKSMFLSFPPVAIRY